MKMTYRWQASLVITLGLLMAILDNTVVNVVLPQMETVFQTDNQTISWIATAYFLASAAVIPIVGYLSDRVGSKIIFLIALSIFTFGSVLCACSPNEQLLIASRVVQGIGSGALLPVAMAIIFRLFDPTERASVMALLMVPLLLGPAFGPTLGGYLATAFSWNAIFTINLPIGVIAFILAVIVLRNNKDEREADRAEDVGTRRFDFFGLLFSMTGFTALVYGINRAGSYDWGDKLAVSFIVVGGILLLAFIVVELLVKDPVMDVRLFLNYTFTMTNIVQWVTTAAFFGSLFLLPQFFEKVQNQSALTTGTFMISQGLAMAVSLAISGKLYNKVGPRILAVIGILLVAVSMIGFTRLDVTTTGADLQIWLILRGLGLGLVMQPVQMLAVSVVSNKQMAKASSLINSTKTVAGAVGVAVLFSYLTQQAKTHGNDIAAGLKTYPLGDVAATCMAQVGKHAQPLQDQSAIHACVTQHALTMGLNDAFMLSLIGCLICMVLALFLGRDPALEAAKRAKERGEKPEIETPVPILSE